MDNYIKMNCKLKNYLDEVVLKKKIPGAVALVGKGKDVIFYEHIGYMQIYPKKEKMKKSTLFDIASLTKVISTWPAIMKLIQEKQIGLEQTMDEFFGDNINKDFKKVTVKNLLTHTAGLPERTFLKQYGNNKDDIINGLITEKLQYQINTEVSYSNRGFIILGNIIEKVSELPLDVYVRNNIWSPLGMKDTLYNPSPKFNIASTEYISKTKNVKKGIVHDENAELLGGIAGHSGVFSTARDLSKFCVEMLINCNENVICRELIEYSFLNHTKEMNESRGLGWRIFEDYNIEKPLIGHLGFTGTSIWIEPESQVYVILLTNRVHPSRENANINKIRSVVKNIVFGNE